MAVAVCNKSSAYRNGTSWLFLDFDNRLDVEFFVVRILQNLFQVDSLQQKNPGGERDFCSRGQPDLFVYFFSFAVQHGAFLKLRQEAESNGDGVDHFRIDAGKLMIRLIDPRVSRNVLR